MAVRQGRKKISGIRFLRLGGSVNILLRFRLSIFFSLLGTIARLLHLPLIAGGLTHFGPAEQFRVILHGSIIDREI